MPIGYHPGVVDRSGEFIAQGVHNRNQQLMQIASLLIGMGQQKQAQATADDKVKQDKLDKGIQARSALKKLGVDDADGMSADEALGVAQVIPQIVQQRQRQQDNDASTGFVKSFSDAVTGGQPQVNPAQMTSAASLFPNNPAMLGPAMAATGAVSPSAGMDPRAAVIQALRQNPNAMRSPEGREAFERLLTTSVTPQRQSPQVLPNVGGTGANVMVDASGKVVQLRPATSATAGQKNLPPMLEEGEQWEKAKTASGKAIPGLYHSMKGGKRSGKQWYDPQSAPRGYGLFSGAEDNNEIDPNAETAPAGGAAPAPRTAQGGYEVGVRYGGLKYLGGDPSDENNWEQ
jgi:hypothetical protein